MADRWGKPYKADEATCVRLTVEKRYGSVPSVEVSISEAIAKEVDRA